MSTTTGAREDLRGKKKEKGKNRLLFYCNPYLPTHREGIIGNTYVETKVRRKPGDERLQGCKLR